MGPKSLLPSVRLTMKPMKKFILCLSAIAGLVSVSGSHSLRADVGPYDDGDNDYQPRDRYREERRERRDYREESYAPCRPERVYVIERDCPVRRVVYFDPYGRCFYPAGPRRVYVNNYYREYPRSYRHRPPHVDVRFGFGG